MSQSHPGITNIAVADSDLPHLDRLVGVALTSGYRPNGKRPSRATIVGDLIRRAAGVLPAQQAQSVPQQPPGAALGLSPACAAPAQQDAPPADPLPAVDIEDALEHAFWSYDQEHKRSGEERLTWKKYVRAAFEGQIGVAPTPATRSTPPSLPPASAAPSQADAPPEHRRGPGAGPAGRARAARARADPGPAELRPPLLRRTRRH